jgi:hypothetical protein
MDSAVSQQKVEQHAEPLGYASSSKEQLLIGARHYLEERDYINALISIVRAERAEGDDALDSMVRGFKNSLLENLHARALHETAAVEQGKGLDMPLKYMVFYTDDELIYPAFNVPVTFQVQRGSAQITERGFTNTNGVAQCSVVRVNALDGGELLITANVYLNVEGELLTIEKLERDFLLYHRSLKEQTMAFVVFERNIDQVVKNSVSGKRIEQFFIQNRFSVLHGITETDEALFSHAREGDAASLAQYRDELNAQLLALTLIETRPSSKVSEGFYFAKSTITLVVVDFSTGEVVFESVIEDVKGGGNTEEKAGEKAVSEATARFVEQLHIQVCDLRMK